MQTLVSKIFLAAMFSLSFLSPTFAGDDVEGKQIEIDSTDGKKSITVEESQTGDQSGAGTAVTDHTVDDDKTTDEDDNTDKPKYQE
ncbi:hypothetical protein [Methylophaga sp.]|uniref:hypothetical protein n=1 Tax=Methylophaga sp. TaxID=2024840 RepID=UPI00272812E2|nr:hypothetical protein [Methylophaga sp.]MDO8826654.1 hypothetical protein [Methylophaga sp.]